MRRKSDSHFSLNTFIHEVGVPLFLHTDGSRELRKAQWGQVCKKIKIQQSEMEPYSPWKNHAEREVVIIRRKERVMMQQTQTPIRLWDYVYVYASEIRSLIVTNNYVLQSRTPFEKVHGYTPDIS